MNKPRKEYLDSRGIAWHRYDSEKCPNAYYSVPPNVYESIQQSMYECISTATATDCTVVEHEYYMIHLPFFSVPMWISREDDICSYLDFCYCTCYQCQQFIAGPAQLCVLFLLAKDSHGYFSFNWQVVLQCKCSIKSGNYDDLHYFPFLLHVQFLLSKPIEQGWKHFIESKTIMKTCTICDIPLEEESNNNICTKTVCHYLSDRDIVDDSSNMTLLLDTFFMQKIDLVSVLVSPVCYESKCRKRLKVVKQPINVYWSCKRCRCAIYCSEQCLKNNEDKHCNCKCFLDIYF